MQNAECIPPNNLPPKLRFVFCVGGTGSSLEVLGRHLKSQVSGLAPSPNQILPAKSGKVPDRRAFSSLIFFALSLSFFSLSLQIHLLPITSDFWEFCARVFGYKAPS